MYSSYESFKYYSKNIDEDHIIPIIDKLEEAGCELQIEDRQIQIKAPKKIKIS